MVMGANKYNFHVLLLFYSHSDFCDFLSDKSGTLEMLLNLYREWVCTIYFKVDREF